MLSQNIIVRSNCNSDRVIHDPAPSEIICNSFTPVYNALIEFYWIDPSVGPPTTSTAHLIGATYVDFLGDRYSAKSYTIVKCPETWFPQFINNGHECLIVRCFEPLTDPLGPNKWNACYDRHVAQRNIAVINSSQSSHITHEDDSESNRNVLEIPLRLQCSSPTGKAILEVTTEKVQNVNRVMLLEGKHNVDLQDALNPIETVGVTDPIKLRQFRNTQYLDELENDSGEIPANLLKQRIEFERGCDELESILFVKVALDKNECRIYRIRQLVNDLFWVLVLVLR